MGTISSAFNIITGALDAEQAALNITSNNVANANTSGYTREVPTFQENSPVSINGTSYGTGVTVTGAQSLRDRILQERLDQQQQTASASGARLQALQTLQSMFTPSSGTGSSGAGDIGTDITKFFIALSNLEATPTSNSLQQGVLSAANTLAGDISNAASQLGSQRQGLDEQATSVVPQVNALTDAIAKLNQQIMSTSPTGDAGTLEDERQQDLSKLSQLIGINQISTENNGISITTTSGQVLVAEGQSYQMTTSTSGGMTQFLVGGNNITSSLASGGGQLGGILQVRDQDIPNTLSQLDTLASGISTAVNTQNALGYNSSGVKGTNIFSTPPAGVTGSALAMKVVATSVSALGTSSSSTSSGDSGNVVALAGLGNSAIAGSNLDPSDFFSNFVTQLGSTVSQVQTENTAQNASVTQMTTQINSLSQVNLNDEAASLTTYERSYQAASQVFAILNTLMSDAMNLGMQTAVS